MIKHIKWRDSNQYHEQQPKDSEFAVAYIESVTTTFLYLLTLSTVLFFWRICFFRVWDNVLMKNLSTIKKFKFDREKFKESAETLEGTVKRNEIDQKLQEIGITLADLKEALRYEN